MKCDFSLVCEMDIVTVPIQPIYSATIKRLYNWSIGKAKKIIHCMHRSTRMEIFRSNSQSFFYLNMHSTVLF